MNSELEIELNDVIEKSKQVIQTFGVISFSLEKSLKNIVRMIIEKTKTEIEGIENFSDREIELEIKDELLELKLLLHKSKVTAAKIASIFKVEIESEEVELSNVDFVEQMIRHNDILFQDFVSEFIAELEVLEDQFAIEKDIEKVKYIKQVLLLLEKMTEISFELNALFETFFDWDLEVDLELEDFKEIERGR